MADAETIVFSYDLRRRTSYRAPGRLPCRVQGDVTFSLETPPPCEKEPHLYSLHACFLCRRPLGAASDVFMYRGDVPFCSEECRQEQIEVDEAREREISYRRRRHRHHREQFVKQASKSGGCFAC